MRMVGFALLDGVAHRYHREHGWEPNSALLLESLKNTNKANCTKTLKSKKVKG